MAQNSLLNFLSSIEAGAPQHDATRFKWFLDFSGKIVEEHQHIITQFMADRGTRDSSVRQLMANRGIAEAFSLALSFMAGDMELVDRVINEQEVASYSNECMDVIARRLMLTKNYSLAVSLFKRISENIGKNAYCYARVATLERCAGNIDASSEYYNYFYNCFDDVALKQACIDVEAAELEKRESFRANDKFWGDESFISRVYNNYINEFSSMYPLTSGGNQINKVMHQQVAEVNAAYGKISGIINIGTFCGIPDFNLASLYDDAHIVGYDRNSQSVAMNREKFIRSNLRFASGDLRVCLSELRSAANGGALALIHVRTCTEMTSEAVRQVYSIAYDSGVEWILGAEYLGGDPSRKSCYDQNVTSGMRPLTIQTVNHNYERLLSGAGYQLVSLADEPIIGFGFGMSFGGIAVGSFIRRFVARRSR